MKNEEIRKQKYEYLRKQGLFNSEDANLLKDRAWVNIYRLCNLNVEFLKQQREVEKERYEMMKKTKGVK